jgi:hypothetical protein
LRTRHGLSKKLNFKRDQGKPEEAREFLALVYGWFTEGWKLTIKAHGQTSQGKCGVMPVRIGHLLPGRQVGCNSRPHLAIPSVLVSPRDPLGGGNERAFQGRSRTG